MGGGGDGGSIGRAIAAVATSGTSELFQNDTSKKEKALGILTAGQSSAVKEGVKELNKGQVRARKEAMAESARLKAEADALRSEMESATPEQDAQAAGQQSKSRQRKRVAAAQGRSDTILTGPLGLTSSGPKSGKTLLGA